MTDMHPSHLAPDPVAAALRVRIAALETRLQESEARAGRARRDLALLAARLREADTARIEADRLRLELVALRTSRSWKLTRPLRGFGLLARFVRDRLRRPPPA